MKIFPSLYGIIILILISFSHSTIAIEDPFLLSFNSYIELDIDTYNLDKPLELDVTVEIPILIDFWTDIPSDFNKLPTRISNWILFGGTAKPLQKIKLEIQNSPSWLSTYLLSTDILLDIPYESDGRYVYSTSIFITPSSDAPNFPFELDIIASSDGIKRLNGFMINESIQVTPEYLPLMEINEKYLINQMDRTNKTIIPIEITYEGNHLSQITPKLIYNNSSYFDVEIEPKTIKLMPKEKGVFNLSVELNTEFEFYEDVNVYESIEINFKCERFPPKDNNNSIQESIFFTFTYEQNDMSIIIETYSLPISILLIIVILIIIIFKIRKRLIKS